MDSTSIAAESNPESNEKDDIDEGVIPFIQLVFYRSFQQIAISQSHQVENGYILRELKPPITAKKSI